MGKHWKNMLGLKDKEKPESKPIAILTAQRNSQDITKPRDKKEPQIQIITAAKKKKEPKQGAVYPTRMGGGIFSPYPGAAQTPLTPPASPGINKAGLEQKSLVGPSPAPSVNLSIVSGSTAATIHSPANTTTVASTNNPSGAPQATANLANCPPTRSSSTSSSQYTAFTTATKRNSTTIQPVPDCDDSLRRAPSSGPAGDPTIVLPPIEDKEPPEPKISIIDDEGDLLLECVPDDYDESDSKSPEIRAFKVCSHILRRTSPVFKRMFSPNSGFLESEVCEADGLRHASVTCHADSMEIMLNIVHYRRENIPKELELSAQQLRNLAIFSDQYDVPDASASHVESWVSRWTGASSIDSGNRAIDELSSLLLVAYVFKLEKLFEVVTRDLAVRCVWKGGKVYQSWDLVKHEGEEIELSDLLPPKLQEAIHNLHTQTGRDIMDDSVAMMTEYLKVEADMIKEDYITPLYALATYPYEMKERFLADSAFHYVLAKFLKRSGLTADEIIKKTNITATADNGNRRGNGRKPRSGTNRTNATQTNVNAAVSVNTNVTAHTAPPNNSTAGAIETCETTKENAEDETDHIEALDLPVSLKFILDESTQIDNLFNKSEVRKDHVSRARFCREWASKVTTHLGKLKGLQLKDFLRN